MDYQLEQAVRETRAVAAGREGDAWTRLRAALDALEAAGGDGPRLEQAGDLATPGSVVAALYTVHEQPTEAHATEAARALEQLRDGAG